MAETQSDAGDLRAAVAGDRDAVARLLLQHGDRLARRIASRLELNPFADFSAEDVLQEAYVDAFVNIRSFDPSRGTPFSAWLDRIAENRLVSMLRERRRQKRGGTARRVTNNAWRSSAAELVAVLEDHRGASPSQDVALEEAVTAIRVGADELPDDQRLAVEMRCFEERSMESTAEELGKTDGAVRGLLHRAKQSLRVALGNSSQWFRRK